MKSLSIAAGKNETYVRDILEGRVKNPSYASLKSIADQLRCDVSELTEGNGMQERQGASFRALSGGIKKKVDPDQLVDAMLMVNELALKNKIKLSKQDISGMATQACLLAKSQNTKLVTKNLVQYLLEVHKEKEKS